MLKAVWTDLKNQNKHSFIKKKQNERWSLIYCKMALDGDLILKTLETSE